MSGVAGEELEFKLELTPQEMQRIGAHPALEPLTVGRPETSMLRSIYFDTPDHGFGRWASRFGCGRATAANGCRLSRRGIG
jgi:hypothetical protein